MREAVRWFGTGHMAMFSKFQAVFGVSLRNYWIDNVHGLNAEKFAEEVLHCPPRQLLTCVREKFKKEGVDVVKRLLPKPVRAKKPRA